MPKSVPSVGQENWGQPLNDHLAQTLSPVNGGINIWNNANQRPWPNGDTTKAEEAGRTGINRANGRLERWNASENKWEVIGERITTPYVDGVGTVSAQINLVNNAYEIYGDPNADFTGIEPNQTLLMTHNEVTENLGSLTNVTTNTAGKTTELAVESVDVNNKIIYATRGSLRSHEIMTDSLEIGEIASSASGSSGRIYTITGAATGLGGMQPGDLVEVKGVFNGSRVASVDYDNNSFETNGTNNLGTGNTLILYRLPRPGTSYRVGQISLSQRDITDNTASLEIAPFFTKIDRLQVGKSFESTSEVTFDPDLIAGTANVFSVNFREPNTNDVDKVARLHSASLMVRSNYANTPNTSGVEDYGVVNQVNNLTVRSGYLGATQGVPTSIRRIDGLVSDFTNAGNENYIDSFYAIRAGVTSGQTPEKFYNTWGFYAEGIYKNYLAGNTAIGGNATPAAKLQVDGEILIGSTSSSNLVSNPSFNGGDATGWNLGAGWSVEATPNAANVVFTGARHTPGSTAVLELTSATLEAGRRYRLVVFIKERTAGTVNLAMGGVTIGSIGSNREHLRKITANSADNLTITPSNDFDGIVTSIQINRIEAKSNSNLYVLSNTGMGTMEPTERLDVVGNIVASGTITPNSDERLKTDIQPLSNALEKVSALKGVTYDWQDPAKHGNDASRQVGLIAQDVEKVLPEAVRSRGPEQLKALNYNGLTGLLVEAIKEQQALVEEQRQEIETLRRRLDALES